MPPSLVVDTLTVSPSSALPDTCLIGLSPIGGDPCAGVRAAAVPPPSIATIIEPVTTPPNWNILRVIPLLPFRCWHRQWQMRDLAAFDCPSDTCAYGPVRARPSTSGRVLRPRRDRRGGRRAPR